MATMIDTVIRPMDSADIPAVRDVLVAANHQFAALVAAPIYAAYMANVLDIEARLDLGQSFVAEHDGRIVGTITYYRDANDEGIGPRVEPDTAGIRAVAIHPDARGLGLARRLAEAAIDHARADGKRAIVLHTWHEMTAAIALYERLGFRREPALDAGTRDFFTTGVAEDIPAIAFRLALVPAR